MYSGGLQLVGVFFGGGGNAAFPPAGLPVTDYYGMVLHDINK